MQLSELVPRDVWWHIGPGFPVSWFDSAALIARLGVDGMQKLPQTGMRSTVGVSHRDGTAVLEVRGVLTRYENLYTVAYGGASTIHIADAINNAMNDASVRTIVLLIDSPGGTAQGTSELADLVFGLRGKGKQIIVQIDGTLASAAYFIGSQADKVYANHRSNQIGSIGTVAMLEDNSQQLAKEGRKIHVFATGMMKTIGYPGVALSPEQIEVMQDRIDHLQEDFTNAVLRGRKLSPAKLKPMLDGRMVDATDAVKFGLIDGIQPLEKTLSMLKASPKFFSKGSAVSSYEAIKTACVGATPDFIAQALDRGLDASQSAQAFVSDLQAKISQQATANTALQAELATAKTEIADLKVKLSQKSGAPSGVEFQGSATQAFQAAIGAFEKTGLSRAMAVSRAVREYPELHRGMLSEYNRR